MAEAWRELGQSELAGSAHNPRIVAMFDELGHPNQSDETAWCAAFVGACLERGGIASTRSLSARSYLEWGASTEEPGAGAIVVLARGSDPALGHVGFLVGATDTSVFILGGNQSDAVTVAGFERERVLGFRLPEAQQAVQLGNQKFELALSHVLAMEGGWTDDPHDPGGPTNKGITLAVYARERAIEITSTNFATLKSDLPPRSTARSDRSRFALPASPTPDRRLRATPPSDDSAIARSRISGGLAAAGCAASMPPSPPLPFTFQLLAQLQPRRVPI
jgi:uncharacterized protein (TIGR02594 family)